MGAIQERWFPQKQAIYAIIGISELTTEVYLVSRATSGIVADTLFLCKIWQHRNGAASEKGWNICSHSTPLCKNQLRRFNGTSPPASGSTEKPSLYWQQDR